MSDPVVVRKATLVDLSGAGDVVRRTTGRHLPFVLGHPGVRRAVFLVVLLGLIGLPVAVVLELRLRTLAEREGPGRVEPHQELRAGSNVVRSLLPGLSWVRRPRAGDRDTVRLNAWGFHDDEFVTPKPAGTYRIVIAGDSMTMGRAAGSPGRTYPNRLEARLADRAPEGRQFDVLNLGIEGYQAVQIHGTFRHVAFEGLEPDLAVYALYVNDLTDTRLDFYQHRGRFGECDREGGVPSTARLALGTVGSRLRFWIKTRSSLHEEAKHRLALFRLERVLPWLEGVQASIGEPGARVIAWWRRRIPFLAERVGVCNDYFLARRAIGAMADLARDRGIPFVIFTIPQFQQLEERDAPEERFLARICRLEPDVTCHDPSEDLLRTLRADGRDWLALAHTSTDHHPSVYGHAALAASLETVLEPILAREGAFRSRPTPAGPTGPR